MAKKDNILKDMQGDRPIYEGSDPIPSVEYLEAFQNVLQSRRSIRVYDGERIDKDIVEDCLRDATLAPSSSNLQPYQLIWAKSDSVREALGEACLGQPAATTAGELFVVVAKPHSWKEHRDKLLQIMTDNGTKDLPKSVHAYYNQIIPKVMTTDRFGFWNLIRRIGFAIVGMKQATIRTPVSRGDHRIWAHIQASLAAQTLMLSLSAHGYDSCPMGGMDEKRVKRALNLSGKDEVTMVISAGKRKPEGLYGPRFRLAADDLIQIH